MKFMKHNEKNFALWEFQERKKKKEKLNIFKAIIAENFPNLGLDIQIQESQRMSKSVNPN